MSLANVDLSNCDREPIHILGQIQSYGYLLAIHPDTYTIVHASENIADLLGLSATQVLGQPLENVVAKTDIPVSRLMALLKVDDPNGSWETQNPYAMTVNGQSLNLVVHQHKGPIVLEWEPSIDTHDADNIHALLNQRLITESLAEVQTSQTLTELLQNTARRVKAITGFDRVMVYRFGTDWHGQVIAEEKEDYLEPFLGLHYPASDIPKQARELYKVNLVRLIADVGSTPSRILSQPNWPDDKPLDLTQSVLRAVSPIHIEYLKNMGVQASMSISLIYQDELWGLISCHNTTPRFVDYPARRAAKFVSQLLSVALEFRKDREDLTAQQLYQQAGLRLHEQLVLSDTIVRAITQFPTTALDVTSASGAALLFDGKLYLLGKTPDEPAIRAMADWMGTTNTTTSLETSQLPSLYPPAGAFREVGAGLLAIVLSRELNEYLFWFKPERVREVSWAGNPNKPIATNENGSGKISPRTSFAAWTEMVHNTSVPWSKAEVSAAVKLRDDALQIVNKQANEIRMLNQQLKLAYEELDAFSYTVSHDLRTPLSSIRCYSEILLEEYGKDLVPDAHSLLNKVIDSTDKMRRLIRHILYYSRMGRSELDTQHVDMAKLLNDIREDIMVAAQGRSLRLEIGETPPIYADQLMILQLFTNLLGNAAKYTKLVPEGLVKVSGYQHDTEVIYAVEDNGIGFDMSQADRMFDLFKRLENARNFEGTGVGLTIVKRIIDRHQGRIWFQSEPNKGTTFFVSLPVR